MNKLYVIIGVLLLVASSQLSLAQNAKHSDNEELKIMYVNDQSDRRTDNIDWKIVSEKDRTREARVDEMAKEDLLKTSTDYYNAAMIYQHGNDTISSRKAVQMMRKAIELDSTRNKWLLAAAIDRDLMRRKEAQIYGTQYINSGQEASWALYKIDTTKITDKERMEYGVETLVQQREKEKKMNKKKLSEMMDEGKSISEILEFLKEEELYKSEYDLSESAINQFGYQLLKKGRKEDALMVFQTNVELYPEGYNTYDSLGDALLKMDKQDEGLEAYKKSLELNPENKNAEIILLKFGSKK